jgi:NitT/TauT family transport system permease protein
MVFWRPLTAWAERFRVEESEATEAPRSVVLNLLRRSHVPTLMGRLFGWLASPLDRLMAVVGLAEHPLRTSPGRRRAGDVVFAVVVLVAVGFGVFRIGAYINATAGFGEVLHALGLGLVTFGRVIVLVTAATLIWVPIGV